MLWPSIQQPRSPKSISNASVSRSPSKAATSSPSYSIDNACVRLLALASSLHFTAPYWPVLPRMQQLFLRRASCSGIILHRTCSRDGKTLKLILDLLRHNTRRFLLARYNHPSRPKSAFPASHLPGVSRPLPLRCGPHVPSLFGQQKYSSSRERGPPSSPISAPWTAHGIERMEALPSEPVNAK